MPLRKAFSASVFVICEDRVLLIKHKLLGKWLPPGGELEPGESPAECALRELKEETGLKLSFEKTSRIHGVPAGFITYEEHDAGPKGWHMNFCFGAFSETMEVKSDGSFSEYMWWKPIDVINMTDEQTPRNVRDIVNVLRGVIG